MTQSTMSRQSGSSLISIKGIRDGLLISLEHSHSFDELYVELEREVVRKSSFLRNSRVALEVGGQILAVPQLSKMQLLLAQHGMALWAVLSRREATREAARELGLATRLPGSKMDLQGNGKPDMAAVPQTTKGEYVANALLLKETLRSGRYIYHAGHVIIVGDVNAGAEVVAEGDIIVWGKLRGLVHAGAAGNDQANISALALTPTQLRIADHIAVTPPAEKSPHPIPETAFIRDGQVVAEPWS